MTIVASGAISINSLVGEYGGSSPHAMNEYYRGGGLVTDHSNNSNVPTSGTIDLQDFYGANNTSPSDLVFVFTPASDGGKFPAIGYTGTYGSASDTSILVGGTTYTLVSINQPSIGGVPGMQFQTGGSNSTVPGLDGGDLTLVSSAGTSTTVGGTELEHMTDTHSFYIQMPNIGMHQDVETTGTLILA
jgi:hypothetical protein